MAVGIIGSVGKTTQKITFNDYDVTLVATSQGADNWQSYTTAGSNCYVYYFVFTDLPDAGLTADSDVAVLPRGTITETMLNNFSQINAVETGNFDNVGAIRFYSMTGKPSADIPITLRVYHA